MAEYNFTVDSTTFLPPEAVLAALDARNPVNADFVTAAISDATAGMVTDAEMTTLLSNIPYWLPYNGTAWPTVRPTAAANRFVIAIGGPAAPTWLDSAKHDAWLGTFA